MSLKRALKKLTRSIILLMGGRLGPESIEEMRERGVIIGEDCYIGDCMLDTGHGFLITIGDRVSISSNCSLLTHDASTKRALGYSRVGRVDIADDAFIGRGSTILPNVRIGSRAIIGAGSVIAKDVPDNSVVVGNPQRTIGSSDDFIEKNRLMLESSPRYETYWADKTEEEKRRMHAQLDGRLGFDR